MKKIMTMLQNDNQTAHELLKSLQTHQQNGGKIENSKYEPGKLQVKVNFPDKSAIIERYMFEINK